MHVHIPKPLHGWREFLGEVGIIVVGVLIALGAEQLVENAHWREQVSEARQTLDEEGQENFHSAMERLFLTNCIDRRLDRLAVLVARPGMTPPIGSGWTPIRPWPTAAGVAASTSGTIARMPEDQRNFYVSLVALVGALQKWNMEEFDLMGDLGTLRSPAVLSDVAKDRLSSDIARLKNLNRIMTLAAVQLKEELIEHGIVLNANSRADLAKLRQEGCPMPDEPAAAG